MTQFHASSFAVGRPACGDWWTLAPGRALSMRPRQAISFQVVCGQVWATTDAPHDHQMRRHGDHVLSAGEWLAVLPGERLVVEAWGDTPVRLQWVQQADTARPAQSRWQANVAAPARDLWQASRGAAVAFTQLAQGLAGYAAHLANHLVAGRGRVLSRFESNPP